MRPLIEKPQGKAFVVLVTALLVLAVAPLFIANDFILDGFTLVFIWGAFAGAWNIIGGYAGMVSLGHNAFFGIGAYTSTLLLLHFGLTPWIGMFAGGALACMVGILLGIICFRLRSHYFALATLAFGQVTSIIAMNWRSLTNGAEGLAMPIKPSMIHMAFESKLSYLYIGLALLVIVLVISYAIEHSRLGYSLLAFKENEEAARALGVKTGKVRLIAMAISSFLAAIMGTFYAQYLVYIDPDAVVRIQISVQVALFAIVGGLGTAAGPAIGALIFIPITIALRAVLGTTMPGLHMIIYGVILVLVLLYMPRGIYGTLVQKCSRSSARAE